MYMFTIPCVIHISIHAPQWGATGAVSALGGAVIFQSTHPSGVRLQAGTDTGKPPHISIHAPQWGATRRFDVSRPSAGISIHAPQWGATALVALLRLQPVISIHAPQWGATRTIAGSSSSSVFQSTHPSGVRPRFSGSASGGNPFQSTHPSGVRPQSHEAAQLLERISIHAPQWGATRCVPWPSRRLPHFNPRTPVGCDCTRPDGRRGRPNFNPRTPVGCDRVPLIDPETGRQFQSTHPSGVRLSPPDGVVVSS